MQLVKCKKITWKLKTVPYPKCPDCGKNSYYSADEAMRMADIRGVPLRSYQCPYGGGWHLTKKY